MSRDWWFTVRHSAFAVQLQRSMSTQWPQYSMRTVICLCNNSRRFFIFHKRPSIGFWKTSYRYDACVHLGCHTPGTNFNRVWILAMKTSDSFLRIRISYKTWSQWMKFGCITTTHSPNRRMNTEVSEWAGTVENAAVEICRQGATDRLFQPPRGYLSTFLPAPPKWKLIRTIIWKSCWFCIRTLLANDLTFGTPGSCMRIIQVRTLQGRLWST